MIQQPILVMKRWYNSKIMYLIGAIVGAAIGYIYWLQIGCSSGICAITSKPLNSTLYGAVMGALLFGMFVKEFKKTI